MEVGIQWDPKCVDVSEPEEEFEEEATTPIEEVAKIKLLSAVLGSSSMPKSKISIYDGSLKDENLLDWISEMDKYFQWGNWWG